MKVCKRCGRKGLFLQLNSEGVCAKCIQAEEESKRIRLEKEAEEQRLRLEREAEMRRILLEQEKRRKEQELEALYTEMCSLYNNLKTIDLCDGLEVVSDKYSSCERFVRLCDGILQNKDFIEMFGERIEKQHPFGFYPYVSGNDRFGKYMNDRRQAVDSLRWDCQRFIKNSENFEQKLKELPHVPISLNTCNYVPDEDPDYSNVKFFNVTKSTPLGKVCDFIAVDVETTGLSAYKAEITQLSAIKFRDFEPVDCFSTYIKPKKAIPQSTISINGITDETVKDAPSIEQVVDSFRAYIGDKLPIIGHNLIFDLRFLCNNACITLSTKRKFYDTLMLSKKAYNSESHKLDYLDKAALRIDRKSAHDALSDCLVTGMLFHDICETRTSD